MNDADHPLPIALSAADVHRSEIRSMAAAIRHDPMDYGCSVILDHMRVPRSVTIRHRSSRIGLPVFGTWPIDDLSPSRISTLLDDLHSDSACRVGVTDAQSVALEPMASYALALASARRDLPEHFPYETDGSVEIEICMDDDQSYAFWVNLDDGSSTPYRLDVDDGALRALVGTMPIPCHAWSMTDENGTMDCIGQSASDDGGIHVRARPLDAMETLRMHRVIQDGRGR